MHILVLIHPTLTSAGTGGFLHVLVLIHATLTFAGAGGPVHALRHDSAQRLRWHRAVCVW